MSRIHDNDVGEVRGKDGVIGYYYDPTTNVPGAVIECDDPRKVRTFDTGATRSNDGVRIDPEGFLSPIALDRYCEYLHKNRYQKDGTIRDSDNWQKGIPLARYMKGLWRHMLHAWQRHRGWQVTDPDAAPDIEEDLCAIMFNAQGMLHELLRERYSNVK